MQISPDSGLRGGAAFTLIEILTVIAIIGILAGILIPVVGTVRTKARSVQCVANLRQLHSAVILYANDNKGAMPYRLATQDSQKWHRLIYPYVSPISGAQPADFATKGGGALYLCPSDETPYHGVLSYAFNNLLNDTFILQFSQSPIVLADGLTPQTAWETFRLVDYGSMSGRFGFRHNGRANIVRYDGSASSSTTFPIAAADNRQLWKAY